MAPFAPLPELHQGHPLFDSARVVLDSHGLHPDNRLFVYDPAYDDLLMDVITAFLEDLDPHIALHSAQAARYYWRTFHITGCDASWRRLQDASPPYEE